MSRQIYYIFDENIQGNITNDSSILDIKFVVIHFQQSQVTNGFRSEELGG